MSNICSYGGTQNQSINTSNFINHQDVNNLNKQTNTRTEENFTNNIPSNDFFTINGDRLEVFGVSINIDDLIILVMLFFMFREKQIDYTIIIILALILFDQN